MQQKEYFGFGNINNLKHILKKENSKNIFLVTGKKSFDSCGAKKVLEGLLKDYKVYRFNEFSSNPDIKDIREGYGLFKKSNYDTLISIGGGSVIDVAKAIKLFHYNNSNEKIPLVAIPTTAGSGSEATYFIVYYKDKEKQSKGDSEITLPDYAICDPQFTLSLPTKIAASTGMDALSQAIESYWCINSTKKSKKFAKESILLLKHNLEASVKTKSLKSKLNVMKATNLAGKAINITKTTACHSISYPITSHFNIPHGHAVGLTLGEMLIYNSEVNEKDCLDSRGVGYVKKTIQELVDLIGVKNVKEAKNRIKNLMNNIGLETRLSELSINKQGMELIVEKGFEPERVKNNPRLLKKQDLRCLLNKVY